MIKNATRLKMFTTLLEKKKKKETGEREGVGEEGKKPLAIYFLCVLLPERQSADQQFV